VAEPVPPSPPPPPAALSAPFELDIDGYILPLRRGQPVWLEIPGLPGHALPIFSDQAALDRAEVELPGFSYDRRQKIDDGPEFLSSIPQNIDVIIDPWITERQTTRYRRVYR
jgi:hypothetical protein